MRPGTLAPAAAVTIGWAGWATAAPIASPSAAFQTNSGVELVRRHHRGHGWGGWGHGRFERFGRDFGGDSGLAETTGRSSPEPTRLDRRRRGGWVDPPRDGQDSR